MTNQKPIRAAVIYHYFAHYRETVMRELMRPPQERANIQYTFVSDPTCPVPDLKVVDPALAAVPSGEGGLRWRFVRNRWLKGTRHWQHGVLRLALGREYDVLVILGSVHCLSNWLVAPLARLSGKRVVWWTQGLLRASDWRHRVLYGTHSRLADGVLVYGHGARRNLIGVGIDPDRLYVVYNSLDHRSQVDLRRDLASATLSERRSMLFPHPADPILLWIGRLTARKRLDWLLQSAFALGSRGLPVNVFLIGDGPERAALQATAASLGLQDRVRFYGPCHDERTLAPLIAMSDVCVAPGEVGLTVMHALVYGTPCITHDNPERQGPEYEAIVPGQSGLLYHYGDQQSLTAMIEDWLSSHPDRARVRADCQAIVDRYYTPRNQAAIIDAAVHGVPASEIIETADFAHVLGTDTSAGEVKGRP